MKERKEGGIWEWKKGEERTRKGVWSGMIIHKSINTKKKKHM